MRTANPALKPALFNRPYASSARSEAMTLQGAAAKTALLLLLAMLSAGWVWKLFYQSAGNPEAVSGWIFGGLLGGMAAAFATIFKKEWAPVTAPLYALLEGLFLGGVSSMLENVYPGIVIQAIGFTFATLAAMLFLYSSGIIRVTEKFKMGVAAATGGIALVYLSTLLLGFFGISVPFVFQGGPFGILFSLFVVGVAAFNLILDFDIIERGAQAEAPKYMEWYCAFGLMVTLVWLYVEMLRLLAKIRDQR